MNGMDRADAGARLNVLVGGRVLGISWPMQNLQIWADRV
jgi:hypothetical protein